MDANSSTPSNRFSFVEKAILRNGFVGNAPPELVAELKAEAVADDAAAWAKRLAALPYRERQLQRESLSEETRRELDDFYQKQDAEEQKQREAEERQRTKERQEAHFREMAGPRYASASLDNYEIYHANQKPVFEKVREIVADMRGFVAKRRSVVLFGTAGSGKDHLLAVMLREAGRFCSTGWEQGQQIIHAEASGLRDSREAVGLSDPVNPAGSLPDWQMVRLFSWIDGRYRSGLPIWTTLNAVSLDNAKERLSVPIFERLAENAIVLECRWPSYRTRGLEIIGAKGGSR